MSTRRTRPQRTSTAESTRPPPTNERVIEMFFHCALCVRDPRGPQPSDIEAGWTTIGLQVWCRRHDLNILHVDFEGQQHPANCTARRPPEHDDPKETH